MSYPSVSVCFPAYNEENTVGLVLENAYKILKDNQIDFELIVCNDASQDRTGQIIDQFANDKPEVRVIQHSENKGIRETFEELNHSSKNTFVFLNSTDGQWKTESLLQMLPMTEKWDVIIASRIRKPYGIKRLFISWFFNLLPKLLFGVNTFDAGAVKLIRREIIRKFRIISSTPFSEAERLVRAARAGYRITEYPVEVDYRKSGKSTAVKWSVLRHTMADVFRVWLDVNFPKDLSR
jgi:glycosyltransferase involved in cell wall biosynthesis